MEYIYTALHSNVQEGSDCPAGLHGAFDTNSARDDSFSIECHSDQVLEWNNGIK